MEKLFSCYIIPPYISSEFQRVEVFSSLLIHGKYNSFKLVEGVDIPNRYKNYLINSENNKIKYSFPEHSAGPFGNDISGPWMTAQNFFYVIGLLGIGWRDIHATKIDIPDEKYRPKPKVNLSIEI